MRPKLALLVDFQMFTPHHESRITCHLSSVTYHLSPVTCHLSTFTCHLSSTSTPTTIATDPSLLTPQLSKLSWLKKTEDISYIYLFIDIQFFFLPIWLIWQGVGVTSGRVCIDGARPLLVFSSYHMANSLLIL